MKSSWVNPYLLYFLFLLFSCSNNETFNACDENNTTSITESICLRFQDITLSTDIKNQILTVSTESIIKINNFIQLDDIFISFNPDENGVIAEIGLGGYNPNPNEIIIYYDPKFANLSHSITTELPALLAHEIHHAIRRRSVGYGNTLLEALVSEGLADWFSIEVMAIQPPLWTKAVTGTELQTWIDTARTSWHQEGYNHAEWFYGTTQDKPRWLGYSMGFSLVLDYLQNNPGSLPSTLHDEPASSFE